MRTTSRSRTTTGVAKQPPVSKNVRCTLPSARPTSVQRPDSSAQSNSPLTIRGDAENAPPTRRFQATLPVARSRQWATTRPSRQTGDDVKPQRASNDPSDVFQSGVPSSPHAVRESVPAAAWATNSLAPSEQGVEAASLVFSCRDGNGSRLTGCRQTPKPLVRLKQTSQSVGPPSAIVKKIRSPMMIGDELPWPPSGCRQSGLSEPRQGTVTRSAAAPASGLGSFASDRQPGTSAEGDA